MITVMKVLILSQPIFFSRPQCSEIGRCFLLSLQIVCLTNVVASKLMQNYLEKDIMSLLTSQPWFFLGGILARAVHSAEQQRRYSL